MYLLIICKSELHIYVGMSTFVHVFKCTYDHLPHLIISVIWKKSMGPSLENISLSLQ